MKLLLIFIFSLFLPAFANDYRVSTPQKYNFASEENERILFILDFSNSMKEQINGIRKVDMMLSTIKNILPYINKDISIGLRVYGTNSGISPLQACKSTKLLVPVKQSSSDEIIRNLSVIHPQGMTPITYALKQAIKYDFLGFQGKKHIILLTDGGENCDESPCRYVMELIKIRKDVSIDVIAFNIQDRDDLNQLECTALVTHGKFYTANTSAELARSLSNSVSGKKEVEAKIIPH